MPIGKQEEKMVNLQHQLRENQRDLQDFLSDMNSWEEEIRQKENNLKKEKPVNEIKLPPVRNSLDKKKHKKKRKVKSESGNGCQPKRISSYDYRSWDKFDIDKALEDVDGEKETSSSEYETDEEWEMERKKHLAEEEKEKGNGFFRSGDLERAIECYSHGVDLDPTNPLLPANRAMALLKQQKYAAAEVDATTAIALDPMYIKAYMRRASARVGLNKMEEAKTDYQRILTLEPQNKGAKTELEKIEKELKRSEEPQPEVQTFTPSESRIILPAHKPPEQRSKKPLQRIMIEEVGVEEDTSLREAVAKQKALQSEAKQNITKKDEESFEKFVTEPEARNIQIEEISSNPTEGTVSAKQVDDSDVQEVVHVPVTKPDVKTKQNDSQTSVTKPDVKTKQNDSRTSVTKASVPVPSSASMEDIAKKGVPQTSFQFQSDYKVLKHNKEAFYQYFKKISPSNLPNLFGEMLDSDILINILSVIKDFFLPAGEVFEEHLASLAKVKRFDMTAMFLSKKERIVVQDLISHLRKTSSSSPDDINRLAKKYGVS